MLSHSLIVTVLIHYGIFLRMFNQIFTFLQVHYWLARATTAYVIILLWLLFNLTGLLFRVCYDYKTRNRAFRGPFGSVLEVVYQCTCHYLLPDSTRNWVGVVFVLPIITFLLPVVYLTGRVTGRIFSSPC